MIRVFIVMLLCCIVFSIAHGNEVNDSTAEHIFYLQDSIEVRADRLSLGISVIPVSKEKFPTILNQYGFALIRKGTFFAQDIYSNGFKRADIPVVIDGERYHSACPNRMDSPITRINPLEMNQVSFKKDNGSLYSGLGGGISFYRVPPEEPTNLKIAFSETSAAGSGSDAALLFNTTEYTISGRYAVGKGYEDGAGNDFVRLYGYKENYQYTLGEVSFVGKKDQFTYRTSFTYTDNVMFPYLKMDERLNRIYNSSVHYRQHKLYVNFTDHMMDNELRVSNMLMRTEVQNLTLGLTGNNYELVYRNWDSDNFLRPPMGEIIYNHLMPDVSMYAATGQKSFLRTPFEATIKGGLRHVSMGDRERLAIYTPVYSEASDNRWFYHVGLTGRYQFKISAMTEVSFYTEISSVEPELEQLYIAVQKPGMNPYWIGNPTLDQPVKLSARTSFQVNKLRISLFGNQVYDYVTINQITDGSRMYSSFNNIDAYMIGMNLNYNHTNFKVAGGYTYAQNSTDDVPLAEIPPFYLSTTLISPTYKNVVIALTHSYNDAQTRVDENLYESKTTSWQKLDLSLSYIRDSYQFSFEIDNIFDETYHQHLSYLRDPFASGVNVNEPGLTIRLNLFMDYNL